MNQDSKSAYAAHVGAFAGWLALAGVLAFSVIGPMIVAGQRVSGTLDPKLVQTYFRHDALALVNAGGFLILLAMIPFALALREVLAIDERARFLSQVGLVFVLIAAPLYLTEYSLQAALVTVSKSSSDILPLFRFWDILYNSAIYLAEAAYAFCFARAMRDVSAFPRWMPWWGIIVGALQLINMSALFVGIPDDATLVGNLSFVGWFIGSSVGLTRLARRAQTR